MSCSPFTGVLLLALPLPLTAQTRRLNDPLPLGQTVGTVSRFEVTADERRALYLADPDVRGKIALFSVALDSGKTTELSDPEMDTVTQLSLGRIGRRVAFRGQLRGSAGLFGAPVDGSTRAVRLFQGGSLFFRQFFHLDPTETRLVFTAVTPSSVELRSTPIDRAAERVLASSTHDFDFEFLPDGSRVLYAADGEIRSVPIDGSAPAVVLSTDTGAPGPFVLTPDGRRVVYESGGSKKRLLSAPTDGSAAAVLLSTEANPDVRMFALTPDGTRVVYQSANRQDALRLFSVPTDGSATPVQLDHPPLTTQSVFSFLISPDGGHVAFLQARDVSTRQDLFGVPIGGGANVPLYTPVDANDAVAGMTFSPDGRVVFRRGPDAAEITSIHSVPADGSAAQVELQRVDHLVSTAVTPDGARLVFTRRPVGSSLARLLSAPADRSETPTLLDGQMEGSFTLSPDGARVLYRNLGSVDLFSAPVDGSSPPVKLNPQLTGRVVGDNYRVTSAGRVLFRAGLPPPYSSELFDAPLDGSTVARKLSGSLARAVLGDVGSIQATDEAAFYIADQEEDDLNELWRVELDGTRRMTRLTSIEAGRTLLPDFVVSPSGQWVIYRSDEDEIGKVELHAARADGSSRPLKISGTLPAFADVIAFRSSPDGNHVVFSADRDADGEVELFSVDASANPLLISDVPVHGGQVTSFTVSPNSRRVVYRGDLLTDGVFELFSAPIDAPGRQVRLNDPLPAGAAVAHQQPFEIGSDGVRVVFQVFVSNTQRELFSVCADGSNPPVDLVQGFTTRIPREYHFSADASRVVFRAGEDNDSELFAAPADGSLLPVVLGGGVNLEFELPVAGPWVVFRTNAGLFASLADGNRGPITLSSASIPSFVIAPDGTRVVFSTSGGTFVVPIDGSAAPRLLDDRLLADPFDFSPDGETVIGRWFNMLFAVPLDGSRPAHSVAGEPVSGGSVGRIQPLSGGRIVFEGDIETDDVHELWLGMEGDAPRAAKR